MLLNRAIFYNIQESLLHFRFSNEMIKRRGGLQYAKSDIKLQINFYKMGFVNLPILIYNMIIRTIIRLIPNELRSLFYKKVLR